MPWENTIGWGLGFANANYWSRVVMTSSGVDSIPFGRIRNQILDLLVVEEEGGGGGGLQQQDNGMRSGKMAQEWCQERIVEEGGPEDPEYWESRALHELCTQVTPQSTLESPGTPHGLKEFAEQASQVELRILLATCLERAGYEYNPEDIGIHNRRGGQGQEETFCISSQVPEQSKMQEPIDFHAAQKAANKISNI